MARILLSVADSPTGHIYTFLMKERGYPDRFKDPETQWTFFFSERRPRYREGGLAFDFDSDAKAVWLPIESGSKPFILERNGYSRSREAVEITIRNFNRAYSNNREE